MQDESERAREIHELGRR